MVGRLVVDSLVDGWQIGVISWLVIIWSAVGWSAGKLSTSGESVFFAFVDTMSAMVSVKTQQYECVAKALHTAMDDLASRARAVPPSPPLPPKGRRPIRTQDLAARPVSGWPLTSPIKTLDCNPIYVRVLIIFCVFLQVLL